MSFSSKDSTKILKLKSSIASYYNLQMKKLGNRKLESLFFDHCIITGGCIASLYHDEPVNDIDLYAKTVKSINEIQSFILADCQDLIASYDKYDIDPNGNKVVTVKDAKMVTSNAVTLTNDIQFIHLGEAEDCRNKFDFIHCMPWYDIRTQKLYISESQFNAIKNKELLRNPKGEELTDKRIQKYTKRGWTLKGVQ